MQYESQNEQFYHRNCDLDLVIEVDPGALSYLKLRSLLQ